MKSLEKLVLPADLMLTDVVDQKLAWSGAVTFLIVREYLLFIKRSHAMPSHRGQIAFVGGHKQDSESPWETAKREFEEELSWNGEELTFLGLHRPVATANGSLIFPCICSLDEDPEFFIKNVKSNGEWDEAFLYPMEKLINRSGWSFAMGHRTLLEKRAILFHPIAANSYLPCVGSASQDYILWGATAKMIWNFFKFCDRDASN